MLPAGIISSGGLLLAGAAVELPSGVAAPGMAAAGTAGVVGAGRAGIVGRAAGATALVPLLRRRDGRCRTVLVGTVCAHRSRPVNNKIRASVVVFILPLRLRISNFCPGRFFGSWPRASCWR